MRGTVIAIACLVVRAAAADPVVAIEAGEADVTLSEDTDLRPLERDDEPPGRLCHAPCNASVPGGRRYVIDGPTSTRSDPFDLPASGSVRVVVGPGSARVHDAGRALELAGGLALGFGAALYLTELVSGPPTLQHDDIVAGLVIGGIPVVVAGALLVAHGRTSVAIYDRGGSRIALDVRRGAITF